MRLKEVIEDKGLKQCWIARKLGVSRQTVSNWIRGETRPRDKDKLRLAKLLDIPVSIFFEENE